MVTGGSAGALDFGCGALQPVKEQRLVVAKLDSAGNCLWTHAASAGALGGRAVTTDSLGNVLFTGWFFGTSDFGGGALTSEGGSDIFVGKLGP